MMKKGSGKKIQWVTNLNYIIFVCVNIIGAGILVYMASGTKDFVKPVYFCLELLGIAVLLALAIFVAWEIKIFFTGFGELIEDTRAIRVAIIDGIKIELEEDDSEYDDRVNSAEDSELPPL